MPTAKEDVREMLDRLPDEATYEDIQYHIYVREKVVKGMKDVAEGRVLSHEEVGQRMKKWLEI